MVSAFNIELSNSYTISSDKMKTRVRVYYKLN